MRFHVQNNDVRLFDIVQLGVSLPSGYVGRGAVPPGGWIVGGSPPWDENHGIAFSVTNTTDAIVFGTSKTFSVSVSVPSQDVKSVSFSLADQNMGRSAILSIRLFPISAPKTPESQIDSDDDGVSDYQEKIDGTDSNSASSNLYRIVIESDSVAVGTVERLFLFHPAMGRIADVNAAFEFPDGRTMPISPNEDGTIVFSPSEEGTYWVTLSRKSFSDRIRFRAFSQTVVPVGTIGKGEQAAATPTIPVPFALLIALSLLVEVFSFMLSKVFFSTSQSRLERARQLLIRITLSIALFSIPVGLGFVPSIGFHNATGIAILELALWFLIVHYKTKISGFHVVYLFERMLFREKSVHPTMESEAEQRIEAIMAQEKSAPAMASEDERLKEELLANLRKAMESSNAPKSAPKTVSKEPQNEPLWFPEPSIGEAKKSSNGMRYFEKMAQSTGSETISITLKNQLGSTLNASKATVLINGKRVQSIAMDSASTLSFVSSKNDSIELQYPGHVAFREKVAQTGRGKTLGWTIELQSVIQLKVLDDVGNAVNLAFLSIQGDAENRVVDVRGDFIWQTKNGWAFIPIDVASIQSRRLKVKCVQAHFEEGTETIALEKGAIEKPIVRTIRLKRLA